VLARLVTYLAAFFAGFFTYMALSVIEAVSPTLPWNYPVLIPFTGVMFPGGAPAYMHFGSHVLETWLPFLVAFWVARGLTRGRASALGAAAIYAAFLAWSLAMVMLVLNGVSIATVFLVGLAGTFVGGGVLYLRWVDPGPCDGAGLACESEAA